MQSDKAIHFLSSMYKSFKLVANKLSLRYHYHIYLLFYNCAQYYFFKIQVNIIVILLTSFEN